MPPVGSPPTLPASPAACACGRCPHLSTCGQVPAHGGDRLPGAHPGAAGGLDGGEDGLLELLRKVALCVVALMREPGPSTASAPRLTPRGHLARARARRMHHKLASRCLPGARGGHEPWKSNFSATQPRRRGQPWRRRGLQRKRRQERQRRQRQERRSRQRQRRQQRRRPKRRRRCSGRPPPSSRAGHHHHHRPRWPPGPAPRRVGSNLRP